MLDSLSAVLSAAREDYHDGYLHSTTEELHSLDGPETDTSPGDELAAGEEIIRLMNIYTDGLAEERFRLAVKVLKGDKTADEKLWEIDELMPIPATVSGEKLGSALGVTKTAVQKTSWWEKKRRGRRDQDSEEREELRRRQGQTFERD